MYWWIPMAAGAAVGALQKGMEQPAIDRQRKQQNMINRYAPLFGIAPQALPPNSSANNLIGGALGGGLTGFTMGQNYEQNEMNNKNLALRNELLTQAKQTGNLRNAMMMGGQNLYDDSGQIDFNKIWQDANTGYGG